MAFIHTIAINEEKRSKNTVSSTRTSNTRQYGACIVATTTEASMAYRAAEVAKLEAKRDAAQVEVTKLEAKFGMTAAQAEEKYTAENKRWYDKEDGLFPTERRIRTELGMNEYARNEKLDALAVADLASRGIVNPHDKTGTYSLYTAAHDAKSAAGQIEHLATMRAIKLGAQAVISWHRDAGLAQKAMTSRDADWARTQGDKLEIRTDISVRETKKRAPKA